MYSKKFVYGISAVMFLIGVVTLVQDAQGAARVQAGQNLAAFNQEATGVLRGHYMLIQNTQSDGDIQPAQADMLQTTSSVWVQQAQTMNAGNNGVQGSRYTLQNAYVNANQ